MLDVRRFCELWRRLGCKGDEMPVLAQLSSAYAEPHRAYHNAHHIADCLGQLDSARTLAARPDEVEAALWFHDAVYDPRRADNEELSADRAAQALAGIAPDIVGRITAMIVATKHDREPASADATILLDIDLSILGRDPAEFVRYDQAIRQEYSWVPEDRYRAGRAAVLESFLNRPMIYLTTDFRNRYEAQARRNLEAAIAKLRL